MKIRAEILHALVRQVYDLEQNGEEKRVLPQLPQPGDWFHEEHKLILLTTSLGVWRDDLCQGGKLRANRLNVDCLLSLGIANFEWDGRKVLDYCAIAKTENVPFPTHRTKLRGVKTSPAIAMYEVFRWAWAVHRITHDSTEEMVVTDFVVTNIGIARDRDFATSLTDKYRFRYIEMMQELQDPLTHERNMLKDLDTAMRKPLSLKSSLKGSLKGSPKGSPKGSKRRHEEVTLYIPCALPDWSKDWFQCQLEHKQGIVPDFSLQQTTKKTFVQPIHCTEAHQSFLANLYYAQHQNTLVLATSESKKVEAYVKCEWDETHETHEARNYSDPDFVKKWREIHEQCPLRIADRMPRRCSADHQKLLNQCLIFQRLTLDQNRRF